MNAVLSEFLPGHLTHRWRLALGCILLVLFGSLRPVGAQTIVPLVTFTNLWQYDQSGTNHGTAWREPDFDDSAWATGRGLFVAETTPDVYTVTAPINTALLLGPAPGTTNYYFRTHFNFPVADFVPGLVLRMTNLVDDGCVIYLNGVEAGRLRVPANQNAATYASGSSFADGTIEVITIATNLLRVGDNVLAVEVHQSSANSSDVAWGTLLTASVPQVPVITHQPQSLTVLFGASATFNIGFTGGPVIFQWQKETTPGSGVWSVVGSSSNLVITSVVLASAGHYRVVLSNGVGAAISATALLTVLEDRSGPVMLRAEVQETSGANPTNRIFLYWDERLQSASANSTNNYRITHLGNPDLPVPFTVFYIATPFTVTVLTITTNGYPNWHVSGLSNYVITVNNIRDNSPSINVVAPNSQIPIAWPRHFDLMPADGAWDFHAAAFFEPEVYDEPWFATNYVGSFWWAQGNGVFKGGPVVANSCLGNYQTDIGYQPEPVLFRTTFNLPADIPIDGSTVRLLLNHTTDDGAIFYLNGSEILRYNAPAAPAPLTASTRGTIRGSYPVCQTNFVTNVVVSGVNYLSAAVLQGPDLQESATVFGLRLAGTIWIPGPLPLASDPSLQIAPIGTNAFRLSWTGPGYALESVTNLTANSLSAPFGPWTEVRNMSNPYTNVNTGPQRFFRLKK